MVALQHGKLHHEGDEYVITPVDQDEETSRSRREMGLLSPHTLKRVQREGTYDQYDICYVVLV